MKYSLPLLACTALIALALHTTTEARQGADDALEGGHHSSAQHSSGQQTNPYNGKPEAIAAGKDLFGKNCAGCHGSSATGKRGPDLTDRSWKYGAGDRDLYESISSGRPGGMPSFAAKIHKDGIWKISAFIRSRATGK
jgi:cytochrome c(L)